LSGEGVTVAVLDTGLDASHPQMAGAIAGGGTDLVDGDGNPSEVVDGIDDNNNGVADEAYGHGTFVAGLVRSVAPDAAILPVRILDSDGSTTSWTIARGLAHARALGADVINLSLGGHQLGPIVERQIRALTDADIVVVAAAGNDASTEARYPAAYSDVLSVGAIDGATGAAATFSNHGSWIDVVAPGVDLVSTYPGSGYARWGGTSASAPVVAGTVALVRQAMPTADSTDVVDKITSSARSAGLSNASSYGAVDIAAATERALAAAGSNPNGGSSSDADADGD